MSRNSAILERSIVSIPATQPAAAVSAPRSRPFAELAARLFPTPDERKVIAFAAIGRGAGVTTVIRSLSAELARSAPPAEVLTSPIVKPPDCGNMFGAPFAVPSDASCESPNSLIEAARARSRRVLIDCGSLNCSIDLLQFASKIDGLVLVVEAGKIEKQQVERAALLIRNAGGELLGLVMNKRRYPVPNWLYRVL